MRIILKALGMMALFACQTPAMAQSKARPQGPVVDWFVHNSSSRSPTQFRPAEQASGPDSWLSAADIPASVRKDAASRTPKPGSAEILAEIELEVLIGPDDDIAECRGKSGATALAPQLCEAIRARARFSHGLSRDGKPDAGTVTEYIAFFVGDRDAAADLLPGPQPSDPWPVLTYNMPVRVVGEPQLPRRPDKMDDVELGLNIEVSPEGPPRCRIVKSSGDTVLDTNTCNAMAAPGFKAEDPHGHGVLPVQVRWSNQGVSWRLPIRSSLQDAAPLSADTLLIGRWPDRLAPKREAMAILDIDESGRATDCGIVVSTYSDVADFKICPALLAARFRPAEDVFGAYLDLGTVFTVQFR